MEQAINKNILASVFDKLNKVCKDCEQIESRASKLERTKNDNRTRNSDSRRSSDS